MPITTPSNPTCLTFPTTVTTALGSHPFLFADLSDDLDEILFAVML